MPAPAEKTDASARGSPSAVVRRSRPIYRVFVSSTWIDLQPERRALMDALNRMEEMRFVGMEFFGNRPDDTHDASLDQVDQCEVLVGIIGHRYGSGITEAEYRRARELGLPCFVYFKRDDTSRPGLTDGDPALAAKLAAFKQDVLRDHTVKEFASPAELAANATADLHNWVAARWIAVEREAPAGSRAPVAPLPDADRTNILRLLERIQHDWIEGVLEASLHRRAWMDLGLDWRDEAVEHPWDRILVAPDRPVQTLGDRETVGGVFFSAQNTLLILGEPGAGKTTTLLELTRELVRRARESATEPAPVLLALSTWTGRHRDLGEWLVDELNVRYQVPKRLAQGWLADVRLVLLLDGLDEVREDARAACVEAINAFTGEHAPAGLAVTCRVVEYSQLKERLRLRSAICLQPLTPRQIDAYFERAGTGLGNLRAAMRVDAALRELAQTPLMLSVMTMAWRDAPATGWIDPGNATVSQRREQLLAAYVSAAIRRKATRENDDSNRQLLAVLPWLARQMRARGQTFFAIEQLQPDWLDSAGRQSAYFLLTRILVILALGLPFWLFHVTVAVKGCLMVQGAAVGLTMALVDLAGFRNERMRFSSPWHRAVGVGIGLGLASIFVAVAIDHFFTGLFSSDTAGLAAGYGLLITVTMSTPIDVRARDIQPADAIGWSWRLSARRGMSAVACWQWFLIFGFLEYLAFKGWSGTAREFGLSATRFWLGATGGGLVAVLAIWRWKWRGWAAAIGSGTLIALGAEVGAYLGTAGPIVLTAIIGFIAALFGGLTSGMNKTRARRTGPWFWTKVPLLAALAVGAVIGGLIFGFVLMVAGFNAEVRDWARACAIGGGAVGFIAFFRFGGFQGAQHFILRRLLARDGPLPTNPVPLLDYAARLNLLQKVGFGYRFAHALLLDHFAAKASARR